MEHMHAGRQAQPSVIGFAHRGAGGPEGDNTLPVFSRALALGAQGLESDIGLTRDGVPVLTHAVPWKRGPSIGNLTRAEIPGSIPSLADLYRCCGTDFDLSLDMGRPDAVEAVVRTAEEFGATDRLWLTYWRLPTLVAWRARWPQLHLVYATLPLVPWRFRQMLSDLRDARVDAVNIFHRFWTARAVDLVHQYEMRAFAWGLKSDGALRRVVWHGVDGAFCDDTAGMVRVLNAKDAPW